VALVHGPPLLDDGWFRLLDVRCVADPPRLSALEEPPALTLVLPLRGTFIRQVPRLRHSSEIVADPTVALFFREGEAYRVAHPLGGADRSLDLTIRSVAIDALGLRPADLPDAASTDAATDVLVRRWATAAAGGDLDPLVAGEVAVAIVDRVVRRPRDATAQRDVDRLVYQTRLTVTERLGDRLTLPDLGRLVGCSPFHLARRFRAATGTSIHRYRTRLRVRAALERIADGERDLAGLAIDLGFADHSHLTTTLRRNTGRPPSAFRLPPTAGELREMRTILQA